MISFQELSKVAGYSWQLSTVGASLRLLPVNCGSSPLNYVASSEYSCHIYGKLVELRPEASRLMNGKHGFQFIELEVMDLGPEMTELFKREGVQANPNLVADLLAVYKAKSQS